MKLYSGDLSPHSARVRMQIYAKGIIGIAIELPPQFGTPQFRQKFPIGRIPILDIDGDMLPESEVIAEYLEEIYPKPSMLGANARETAHIRMVARIGDIYIMNNMFMLAGQSYAATRNEGIVDLLAGQVVRNVRALDAFIGKDWLCLLWPHHDGGLCTGARALPRQRHVPDAGAEESHSGEPRRRGVLGRHPEERTRRARSEGTRTWTRGAR